MQLGTRLFYSCEMKAGGLSCNLDGKRNLPGVFEFFATQHRPFRARPLCGIAQVVVDVVVVDPLRALALLLPVRLSALHNVAVQLGRQLKAAISFCIFLPLILLSGTNLQATMPAIQ